MLVTGAARGMDRAAAELFAREGAKVIATDVNDPQPAYADDGINFSKMDVSNENDWKTIFASIVSRYGRMDVLVNNARIGGSFESIENETVDAWSRVVAVRPGSSLACGRSFPSCAVKKAAQKLQLIWAMGLENPGSRITEIFLLLFPRRKKKNRSLFAHLIRI